MGNDSSKKNGPSSGNIALSAAEAAVLEDFYSSIKTIQPTRLTAMWDPVLDKFLRQLITNYLAPRSDGQQLHVDRKRFNLFFQQLVHGSARDGAPVVFEMLIGSAHRETITKKMGTDYVESLIRSYLLTKQNCGWDTASAGAKADAAVLAQTLCVDLQSEASIDDFAQWMSYAPTVTTLQNAVLVRLLPRSTVRVSLHPRCVNRNVASLLSLPSVMYVNEALPADMRNEWRMLYSTRQQGESFSKLLECITKKGPTLLVVKDKEGAVFGAFAPAPWALGPKFFGDSTSFLFRIKPVICIYSSSGYNENYQYLNMGQQTMPNGLGMGGTLRYFGLWLDGDFGRGSSSESCTTYRDHRTLSSTKEFSIDALEAWAVGPEEVREEEQGQRSVLDSNTEARAMLEMLGKKAHSDGYREPDSG